MPNINFFKKPRTYVAITVIISMLLALGLFSHFGFELAHYLREKQGVSFSMSILLAFAGFLNAYKIISEKDNMTIRSAAIIYVSLGFAMGGVYYLVHVSHSGCFGLPADIQEGASIIDFVYFSFVTVTTIGYGDIVPRHTFIRLLVLLHVLFTMYLIIEAARKHQ